MKMNSKLEKDGRFRKDDRIQLYKLLASSNNIIANVISRLGIMEGTDAGWEDDDADARYIHTQIQIHIDYYFILYPFLLFYCYMYISWRALRRDFEIMQRFKDLDSKVELIKDNTRFFVGWASSTLNSLVCINSLLMLIYITDVSNLNHRP